jgi:hypothetical protein
MKYRKTYVCVDKNVLRLEITMHDTHVVQRLQPVRNSLEQLPRLCLRQPNRPAPLLEIVIPLEA